MLPIRRTTTSFSKTRKTLAINLSTDRLSAHPIRHVRPADSQYVTKCKKLPVSTAHTAVGHTASPRKLRLVGGSYAASTSGTRQALRGRAELTAACCIRTQAGVVRRPSGRTIFRSPRAGAAVAGVERTSVFALDLLDFPQAVAIAAGAAAAAALVPAVPGLEAADAFSSGRLLAGRGGRPRRAEGAQGVWRRATIRLAAASISNAGAAAAAAVAATATEARCFPRRRGCRRRRRGCRPAGGAELSSIPSLRPGEGPVRLPRLLLELLVVSPGLQPSPRRALGCGVVGPECLRTGWRPAIHAPPAGYLQQRQPRSRRIVRSKEGGGMSGI